MSKYIDAEAYIKYCDEHWIALNVDAVNAQPAADVKEVVRGRWLEHQEGRWIYAKCSVCDSVQNTKTKYCKNCGAKMDLEVTE